MTPEYATGSYGLEISRLGSNITEVLKFEQTYIEQFGDPREEPAYVYINGNGGWNRRAEISLLQARLAIINPLSWEHEVSDVTMVGIQDTVGNEFVCDVFAVTDKYVFDAQHLTLPVLSLSALRLVRQYTEWYRFEPAPLNVGSYGMLHKYLQHIQKLPEKPFTAES